MKGLQDKLTFGDFNGLTVQEAIDTKYYAMKAIVNKHPDWYGDSVHEYLKDISSYIAGNKYQKKELSNKIARKNT